MNTKVKQHIENYILEAAQTPKRTGRIPINAWSLLGSAHDNFGVFDEVYADGGIAALTRPLKISIGVCNEDWSGLFVHTFRQVKPKQVIPSRPCKTPMLQMYNNKGQRMRRPCFVKTQGSSVGVPVSIYTVEATVGGMDVTRTRKLFHDVYLLSANGNDWVEVYKNGVYSPDFEFHPNEHVKIAIGLQCFTEYCWTVEFLYDNHSMPILFPVSREAARKLVAETVSATEGERRKKVIHFVQSHKRFTKTEEDQQSNVMLHMRGCMFYLWQGCKMKVMPPVNNLYSFERNTRKISSVRRAVFASQ